MLSVVLFSFGAGTLPAQLTTDQRVADFQNLTALYAKRYAPYQWKMQAFNFDLYQIGPWLARVKQAKDDLEFFEICAEYVASLNDTHSSFSTPSRFAADTGIFVDLYDGKPLIDGINRSVLPQRDYPFEIGDEVVSVDGKSAEELIAGFSKLRSMGNPRTTRRNASNYITFRPQSMIPRASELGDTATVVIRRQNGNLETYTVPWTKTGVPMSNVGPVPSPKAAVRKTEEEEVPEYMRLLNEMRNWRLSDNDPGLSAERYSDDAGGMVPQSYLIGLGSRSPIFRPPNGFVQRLGRVPADFHYSGAYESEGFKIGYLRIPNFGPNMAIAIRELDTEIDYFQKNTDGLVIDVMRNPGGGCYMLDVASRLIPYNFYFFGEQLRPTLDRINSLQSGIELSKRAGADQWIIDIYQVYLDQMMQAYKENRGLTGSIPACSRYLSSWPPSLDNLPADNVYTKPMIVLIDDFSISAADIFPSMIQDNGRAPLVGMRTSGGGGSVSAWPAGFYSEFTANNTNSLVLRKNPIVTPDLPAAPYVENIGARPDIQLDYMTKDNLLQGGRPFVEGFTKIIVDQIKASR